MRHRWWLPPAVSTWLERSLANRFAGGAATIGITFILVVAGASLWYSKRLVDSAVSAELEYQAALAQQRIELTLSNLDRNISAVAQNTLASNALLDSEGRSSYLLPFLRGLRLPGPQTSLALCDYRGRLLASNRRDGTDDSCTAPGFSRSMEQAVAAASIIADPGDLLTLTYPVIYPVTQQAEGVLVLRVPVRELLPDLYADQARPIQVRLQTAQGTLGQTASTPMPRLSRRLDLESPFAELKAELVLSHQLDAAGAAWRPLLAAYAVAGVVLLALMIVAVRLMAQRLTAPVKALTEAMEGYSEGKRLPRLTSQTAPDEVGKLGTAFTHLASRLNEYHTELETQVAERTAQLSTIFALSPDGFISFDSDYRINYINPAFIALTGFSPGQLVDKPLSELNALLKAAADPEMPYSDIQTPPSTQASADADATSSEWMRFRLLHPRPVVIEARVRQSATEGSNVRLVAIFRDMTHEYEVDRMKSEFLSAAAHELRTPLASIYGFTELLVHREFDEATTRSALEAIHRQTHRLVGLVNELLDLSRIEAGQGKHLVLESCDAEQLVRDVLVQMATLTAARKVNITVACEQPWIHGDPAAMEQSLTNLIGNAIKYSHTDSAIDITVLDRTQDGTRQIGIAVRDYGIGLNEEQLKHIGQRFWRADVSRSVPGTGLGVSLVKEIALAHGGELQIASKPGTGTTMTMWLPAADEPPEDTAR